MEFGTGSWHGSNPTFPIENHLPGLVGSTHQLKNKCWCTSRLMSWALLFLIYINDLPKAVRKSSVSMYADDTSLCNQSSDITQLNEAINIDLAQVEKWLKGNKPSLNVIKTHSMLISPKPKHKTLESQGESLKLKTRDNELEVVQNPNTLAFR